MPWRKRNSIKESVSPDHGGTGGTDKLIELRGVMQSLECQLSVLSFDILFR